jgi:acetoin utilization protein AcuC
MRTAFFYCEDLVKFDYGPDHPLRIERLKLTRDLIDSFGLLAAERTRVVAPRPADEKDLLLFHGADYIEMLKAVNGGRSMPGADYFGLGPGDNPVFRGLYDWSRLVAGASLQSALMVEGGEADIAFNIAGGLHHALSSRASGFCYINDPVIAIMALLKRGRRVAYIDIDAHHADGVQEAFYATNSVLTVSLHETGRTLFPGTGFEEEIGEGDGRGFSLNVPLPPFCDDELFLEALDRIVPEAVGMFRPDVVVSQLGVDSFRSDPLTHLNLTTNGFCKAVRTIRSLSPKWVALGGGGYDVANVARAWTLAWGIMNDAELADDVPEDFLRSHGGQEVFAAKMRDEPWTVAGPEKERMRDEVERVISRLREKTFPLISGS